MKNRIILILLVLTVAACIRIEVRAPEPRAGNTYYVSPAPTGNDSRACNTVTSSNRRATIAGGITCLTGGDTLVIGAGIYNEAIEPDTIPSGSGPGGEAREAAWPGATVIRAETPCTNVGASAGSYTIPTCSTVLRPAPGKCSLNGSHAVVEYMRFATRNYIIFQGFEADAGSYCQMGFAMGTGQSGVTSAHHIRLQHVYVHDGFAADGGTGLIGPVQSGPSGAPGGPATYIEVLDSTIRNFDMAGNFPIHGGNHCLYFNGSGTIRRNIIANCSPVAHNGQGIGTHSTNGFPTTVDVSGNDVWGTGFSAIEAAEATGMLIYNNVVHDLGSTNGNDCWGVCDAIHVYTGVNTFIANNTIYNITNSGRPGIDTVLPAIAMIGGSSGTTVQNNIIYGGTNNTISASDGGTISNNRCDSGCTTAANPQFTNAAGGNFHLTASSPTTITQGGVPLASSFTTDKDGVAWGSTWGMGAYKYVVSGLSFPTVSDFPSVACCLDNFNRANGALGANWANALSPPFTIVSSRAVAPSGYSRMLWSAATFGGYHEAYAEFPTPPNTADVLLIFAGKESGNNNQWRLYAYNYYGPTWQIDVQSADAVGALTQRVALVDLGVATLPNNTSWGVRVSAGPTLTVYWKYTDGLWYRISQTTQATLPTGPVWIGISGIAPTTVENFGGGTCCSATPKSPTGLNLTWLWRR